jgi:hypothetical protein
MPGAGVAPTSAYVLVAALGSNGVDQAVLSDRKSPKTSRLFDPEWSLGAGERTAFEPGNDIISPFILIVLLLRAEAQPICQPLFPLMHISGEGSYRPVAHRLCLDSTSRVF